MSGPTVSSEAATSSASAPPNPAKSATPQPSTAPTTKPKPPIANAPIVVSGPVPVAMSSRRSDELDLNTVERKGKRPRDPVQRQHAGGIKEAKTFRPTEDDWKNPMAYMRSIADEGARFGIIKIIPPESWNPEFAMDTSRFHFKTRKQELNSVEGGTRANLTYIDQLQKFHKQMTNSVMRFPCVDKKPLDLYELKKAVQARGGFEKVCERKKWAEVGRALGYSGKIMSSLSTSLKHSYERWLYPYEQWLAGVKPVVQMQMEMERGGPFGTPSPGTSPFSPMKRSHMQTPSSLSRDSPAIRASQALQSSVTGRDTQSQPPEAPLLQPRQPTFGPIQSGSYTSPHASFTSPQYSSFSSNPSMQSDQRQSHERSTSGSFSTSAKPIFPGLKSFATGGNYGSFELKRSFSDMAEDEKDRFGSSEFSPAKKPKPDPAPTVTGSHMFQHRFANLAASFRATQNGQTPEICEACGKGDDVGAIVECDTCDNVYHLQCLEPVLEELPPNEWHCSRCLVGTGEYGFGEGSIYSLKQFQQKANDFKENYFKGKTAYDPIQDKPKPVSEDDVEKEFWRLVTNINETVEVEYGADIHSTTHGSGFPTIERNPRDPMSVDPWNLNVLPLHQDSLFKHIKSDISGMTVPWLYAGMCFSTFCWHNEDHYAYSANYQHFGATKTWYGIPGADAAKFEDAMRARIPDLFESQPDLLDQLTTLLPPEQLMKAGVEVYAVDQRAGEFVITFPQAYHAGFNHGFNFNEAVNFAPADWEPFGRAGVERRRDFRKQPCFSHDELLFTAAASKDVNIKTAKWLGPALQVVADREVAARKAFEQHVQEINAYRLQDDSGTLLPFERRTDTEDLPPEREEEYVCGYCKAYSYLSRFVCEKTTQIACLDHVSMVDWSGSEAGTQFVLHTRMPDHKLDQTVQRIKDIASKPDAWLEKFHLATDGVAKPSLKTMRSLLSEGERIPWPLKELPSLKKSVEACNEWVEEAINFIARKQQNRRKSEKVWRKGSTVKVTESEDKDRDFRKIGNIKRLLHRGHVLAFDSPEISTLQQKLDDVRDYQHSVHKFFQYLATKKTEDVVALIDEGKAFGVDLPEIGRLEKVLEQMQWLDKASDPKAFATLKGVDSLLEEGLRLEVPSNHERIGYLRSHKHAGEALQSKIQDWLSKQETINLSQLETFAKTAATVPVSEDVLKQMEAVLTEHREAQKRIMAIVSGARNEDKSKRPTYKAMKDCQEALADMANKPEGWLDLEKLQKRQEDWMRRGKKLFGKTNAPLPILHQHLKIVNERNKGCFDVNEKPRAPVEPQSREHTPVRDFMDPVEVLYCLCRKVEDGMMIEYHSKCLKIARGKYKEDDDFTCPICDHRVRIPRDAIRPKLEEMMAWQSETPNVPFIAEEEETLDDIIETAKTFRDYVQQFTSNSLLTTMEEVPTLRFYLRKIEGADVLLAEETNFFRQELYRMNPIAPQPPPKVDFSASTRKPRPTKEQKLMKEHGVEKPEDLPAHLRYRKGRHRLLSEKEKEDARLRGERISPAQLLFRAPLTSTTFPNKEKARESIKSPTGSSPALHRGDGSAASNASISGASFPGNSPPAFDADGTTTSLQSARLQESKIDPNLFADDIDFGGTDVNGTGDPSHSLHGGEHGNIFDSHGGAADAMNSNFDSMFADLTNEDEAKDEATPTSNANVDPHLMGAA